jgi:hypothetical protein
MSSLASRLLAALVLLLGAVVALAGFALPFRALLGQGESSPLRIGLAAALGTLWVLLLLYLGWRLEQPRAARRAAQQREAQAAQEAALAAAREARAAAGHAALLADPRWTPFHPLIRRWRLWDEGGLREAEQRYLALLADPRRAHHAAGVLEGQRWRDAQLDYFDDPWARITCIHLQPVEAALRAAGRHCWPQQARELGTEAALRWEPLQVRFALPDCVRWEVDEPDPHAGPREIVYCEACDSTIESGHGAPFPAE